jgi:hypothetical protein
MELSSAADAKHPQVGSEVDAPGDLRVIKLLIGNGHLNWLSVNYWIQWGL